jgi:hypothetical protein
MNALTKVAAADVALPRYDAMCLAIAEAHAVDEVKDLRDQARAIEVYSRQARNTDAERQACEIRLRAERKCGELLTQQAEDGERQTPGGDRRSSSGDARMKLSDANISHDQSSKWQALAKVPADDFEADLKDPAWRPTTTGLLDRHEARERGPLPAITVNEDALWLWGRLQDFERNGLLDRAPNEVLSTMLEHMEITTRRLAPRVAAWLARFT